MLSQHYAHALPYALLPVAPPLAALHATRGLHDHFCTRCGQHSALHSTSVRRSNHPALGSHAVTSVCNTCGHISRLHFHKAHSSSSFPSAKNRSRRPTHSHPVNDPSPIEQPKPVPTHPKSLKHKKKPGLAELLQRNRQQQTDSSSSQQQPLATALSAFLTTL